MRHDEPAANILVRRFGAPFADQLVVRPNCGGLGLGTGAVTLLSAAMISALIANLAGTRRDIEPEEQQ